ncbi:hypothetical protein T09_14709, partial [Trichinella sp. T9]
MPIKSIFGRKANAAQSLWNNGLLKWAHCLSQYIGMPPTYLGKYRDLCNWGRRKYVCCTYLIIFYQLISIKPIFRGKGFSQKLQNFMGYIDLLCMINGENSLIKIWAFLIHNHSQLLLIMDPPRYVSFTSQIISDRLKVLKLIFGFHGVSRKLQISWAIDLLFLDYYDRRTTKRTCSNACIYSDFSIDIHL